MGTRSPVLRSSRRAPRSRPRGRTQRRCAGWACARRAATTRRPQKYAEEVWRIPTDHFDPDAGARSPRARRFRWTRSSSRDRRIQRGRLKRRLFAEGLKQRRCEMCGQGEMWRGRRMALVLDHINGVHDDNRLENLRIVCPNCNATLDTHCGRHERRKRRARVPACGAAFVPADRATSGTARRRAPGAVSATAARQAARRVERPPYEQLVARSTRSAISASAADTASATTRSASGRRGALTNAPAHARADAPPGVARTPGRRPPSNLRPVTAPTVVILAAGQGTRMRSRTPKMLHELCGRPMIDWTVAAALEAGAGKVVVVGSPDGALDGRSARRRRARGAARAERDRRRRARGRARASTRGRRRSSSSTATCRS